jgi:hypothetical protein
VHRFVIVFLLLFGPPLAAVGAAQSQATTGVIEGTVSDETGGRLPGATVTLVNRGTNFTRELTTDTDGRFRGLLLPLGAYVITVNLSGLVLDRAKRANHLVDDAAKLLDDEGIAAVPVPGRILFKILDFGSLEEDPELRKVWLAMLSNAAAGPSAPAVHPAFPQILSEMSSLDCQVLDYVASATLDRAAEPRTYAGISPDRIAAMTAHSMDDVLVSLANLVRLQFVALPRWQVKQTQSMPYTQAMLAAGPADHIADHYTTSFGLAFVRACRALKKS